MENIVRGDKLLINTEMGIITVLFSHYSDKYCKKFWGMNGVEYDCKKVLK